MPRITLRKCFFFMAAASGLTLLQISVHQEPNYSLSARHLRERDVDDEYFLFQKLASAQSSENEINTTFKRSKKPHLSPVKYQPFMVNLDKMDDDFVKPPLYKLEWYMEGGFHRPYFSIDKKKQQKLWPEQLPYSDRITQQLMFTLSTSQINIDNNNTIKVRGNKRILLYDGLSAWGEDAGRKSFFQKKCPVNTCTLTGAKTDTSVDAIIFRDKLNLPDHHPERQVWIQFMLESPYHYNIFPVKDAFNWTATYRSDSDLVTPYEKWVYYDPKTTFKRQDRNYAGNKTKQVAFFVSNCAAYNNRLEYAKELSRYINVDIYGACGNLTCARSDSQKCFEMLDKDYKFYLAFENSNCRDYITEKFFVNGLKHDVIPIVMGAHPDDYERAAPQNSYIHVDDYRSPRSLARYLHQLDQNDAMYNKYFRWKGTGEFINTYFMCRLCALLHYDQGKKKHYPDINKWWREKSCNSAGKWPAKVALKRNENIT